MRITTLLFGLAVLGLVLAAPTASADHMGPCTHEYVDHYKHLGQVVPACVERTTDWLFDFGVVLPSTGS